MDTFNDKIGKYMRTKFPIFDFECEVFVWPCIGVYDEEHWICIFFLADLRYVPDSVGLENILPGRNSNGCLYDYRTIRYLI